MRLPRVRFTVRRLVVAIALVAGGFDASSWIGRRRDRFQRLGSYHRHQIVCVLWGHPGPDGEYVYEPTSHDQQGKPVSARQQRIDRWHESLAQRYWNAARSPWLPVPPDP